MSERHIAESVVAWWRCPKCGAVWGSYDERRQSDREWCFKGCFEFPEETTQIDETVSDG